jgi:hypothetical protein
MRVVDATAHHSHVCAEPFEKQFLSIQKSFLSAAEMLS